MVECLFGGWLFRWLAGCMDGWLVGLFHGWFARWWLLACYLFNDGAVQWLFSVV
jgi:hypothetical protein